VEQPVPEQVNIPFLPGIAHTDIHNHSVVSFLRRPQLLSSFRWRTSASRSQNLYTLQDGTPGGLLIPTHMISRGMIRNKLDGFTSFKATAVIKLLVNSQKFQCGRLLMAAAPMPSLLGRRKDFIFTHVSQTQNLQHVQMDVAKDTEVVLRVPFISPYNCFDLIDGKFDWAELRILVYSPLNSINGDCVECNVYGHFEDIELGAPTSGQIFQQSASSSTIDVVRKKESTGRLTGSLSRLGNTLVSKSLNAVSPLLSAGDAILAAAGWSKPIYSKPNQVVMIRPEEGFPYMDGVDQSLVLAMTASNSVQAMPNLVGTGIDETDFHRLKRIPQMIAAFSFSNNVQSIPSCSTGPSLGNQVSKLLWSCAVSPTCNVPACYNITVPPGAATGIVNPYSLDWKQPTTLNYISSPFLYWTGSLVYTFKFIKTDFHSGRVEISFHPFVNDLAPSDNWLADRMDYVYRDIIDLRNNSEISITIPFYAAQPWKRISTYLDPVNPTPPAPGRAKDIITGMLAVRALTPLFATQTVPPTIEVLVEMRAGDDYEVQGPITSKFLPFSFGNVDFPVQQSGTLKPKSVPDFRYPSSIGRIYANWAQSVQARRAVLRGFRGSPLVHLNITGDLTRNTNEAFAGPRIWFITPKWVDVPPIDGSSTSMEEFSLLYSMWNNQYSYEQDLIIANPNDQDELYVFCTQISPAAETRPVMLHTIDITGYGRQLNQQVDINPNQFPLPVSGGGGGGGTVIIDPNTLPLEVKIAEEQLPLPTANQGGGGVQRVQIDPIQFPLPTTIEQPVTAVLDDSQIPLPVASMGQGVQQVQIISSQIPLPTTGGGGGGGGVVTIDPDQLPLWTSGYNVAPKDPRQQSGGTLNKVATSGITETRTNALEGWMPPCISGMEKDAHRPSTAQYCAGERFCSFRQFSRRFAYCLVSGLDSSRMFKIHPIELIRPGILTMRITSGVAPGNDRTQFALYAPLTGAEVSGSALNYTAGMYAFYRGGTRFKAWMDPRENPPGLVSAHLEYLRQAGDVNEIDDNIENFLTPVHYETPQMKQMPEFQVPYYSPTVVSSTWSHGIDDQFDTPLRVLTLSIPDYRQNTQNFPIKIAVAASDDTDFHQFIGPPPVINIGNLVTTGRPLHYPPTGFTPTQKVAPDTARTDEPATSFYRVLWEHLTVSGNPTGGPCPIPSLRLQNPAAVRLRRTVVDMLDDGVDEVDKLNTRSCPPPGPGLDYDAYRQYYQNCEANSHILA
jgi:hypothetical protein